MPVETGLHRFLGFYNHLPQLLHKVGINLDDMLCWEDEIEIRMPGGPRATFGLSSLHQPLTTFAGLLGNNHFLTLTDKFRLGKFFMSGLLDYTKRPDELDTVSVLEYAQKHDVSQRAIERLLVPLTEGLFFLPIKQYSAYALFGLIAPYWKSLYKLRVGAFMGGMTRVMAEPLAQYVRRRGGKVVVSRPVERIEEVTGRFRVTVNGRRLVADAVVLAASLHPAQQILQRSFADKHFSSMLRLKSMPSVTFQLELSGPSMEVDRTTFGPLTALTSFAEQSRTTFRGSKGRLSVILSPPEKFVQMDARKVLEIVVKDAARLGIDLRGKVRDYRKIVIPHDFYELSPGQDKLRPLQKTPIPGFFLAGDYTRQQYLATMEGAVYSGKRAAKLVDAYLGQGLL